MVSPESGSGIPGMVSPESPESPAVGQVVYADGFVAVERPDQSTRPNNVHAPTSARKNTTRKPFCPGVHQKFHCLSTVARSLNCSPVIFAPHVEGISSRLFTSS